MNLEQLLKKLPELYKSRIPVHMQSIPGLGKTSVMQQACEVLSKEYGEDFGFVDMLIPTVDAQDLKGYLIPHKNDDGTATSLYTQPNVLREIENTGCKRGIIAFDEFRQGEQLTQKACAEPILAHKIGSYKIPEGWYIIMASNRAKDKSGAGKSMAHITNRVCVMDIEPSVDAWCTWAANSALPEHSQVSCSMTNHQLTLTKRSVQHVASPVPCSTCLSHMLMPTVSTSSKSRLTR